MHYFIAVDNIFIEFIRLSPGNNNNINLQYVLIISLLLSTHYAQKKTALIGSLSGCSARCMGSRGRSLNFIILPITCNKISKEQ